ncbi:hypothetical protein, partial [Staphylococcus epidermidis]|uniref:hypothetical protein n=1 Tax=Staphylococcus epidermidis TaxID=1282 RepID=UPI0011A376A7
MRGGISFVGESGVKGMGRRVGIGRCSGGGSGEMDNGSGRNEKRMSSGSSIMSGMIIKGIVKIKSLVFIFG